MAGSLVAQKRKGQSRTKVKTGCRTCRIRKVKCDERKPACQKCSGTGRTCDGYESLFRDATSQAVKQGRAGGITPSPRTPSTRLTSIEVDPRDVELLNRYFSTKTIFDVKLGCDEEAKQVLQASLTDLPIGHAVSSLKALREHFETSQGLPVVQQDPGHDYGLQQYCIALQGLASKLSISGPDSVKSALLCCQIFISIEQVRGNYAALAQHIIQGLKIMHQYHARPSLNTSIDLVPASHEQLPSLDVFVIKLFAAPCQFAEPPGPINANEETVSSCPISPPQKTLESRHLRTIVPDMRRELTRIAMSMLEFLDKVSRLASVETVFQLLSEKASLLDALNLWLIDLEILEAEVGPPGPGPISVLFMHFFHQILKVVLLGTLGSLPNFYPQLQTEYDKLQEIASNVGERVEGYRT
ncbi:hypothetical protein EK21DRAFT_116615 [Setomelanomma holmii]|uniref:Zn(2)-C6 fungal-type domain-containing protein n=1 Tax=Setomelanomma holmii TaxID=210430 RepID=A0A9P4H0Z4_9PLEO|nr:hypothetical protein EK21DRAFT_116615 [Setomelanomma holmii]